MRYRVDSVDLLCGAEIGRRGAALASAAILAFSPTHVYYSQEARSYTMTILLVLVSSWFFARAVEENRERDWLLWTLFGVLAVYSHYFGALVLVAQACSLFFHKKPTPWTRMIIHGLAILAIAAPGLTYVLRVPPQAMTFPWMPKPTPKQLLHLALFLGGSGEKFLVSAILWVAGVIAIRRERHGDSTPGQLLARHASHLVGRGAGRAHRAGIAAPSGLRAEVYDLQPSSHGHAGRPGNECVAKEA